MTQSQRLSYVLMAVAVALVGWLHMATLLITALFCYFALQQFSFRRSKVVALALFTVVFGLVLYGLFFFAKQAPVAFPKIAQTTIPAIVEYAEQHNVELPFTDLKSFKVIAVEEVKSKVAAIPTYARAAIFQFVYLIIGIVIAVSLFLNSKLGLESDPNVGRDSIYALTMRELALRVRTFYRSFSRVMGAQILISAINTVMTGLFLFIADFPYAPVLTILTFLCGLLPIVGNLISNTVITSVGFVKSPQMALFALTFLIVVHKLEYFLNSKIIGDRIRNPMWMTLIGLLVGEKLMGIPGMILAPVVLHYIKVEASRNRQAAAAEEPDPDEEIPT
jgi:predicted PurR-regulated permease PerM